MVQPRLSLTASERIKSQKLIGQIFEAGQSFSNFPFRVVYIFPETNKSHLQAAFSVSTKNFKKAFQRNRIKRLMREAYRINKQPLKSLLERNEMYLAIFIIFIGKEMPSFEQISQKMNPLILRSMEIAGKQRNFKEENEL